MKSRYKTSIISKNGRVSNLEDNICSSPEYWSKQAKRDTKANIVTNFGVATRNGKQVVSSVRSEFPNGDVFVATFLGDKKTK